MFSRKQKFVCIGFNKTGTTSLEQVFLAHGYRVGNQRTAECQLKAWRIREWSWLQKYLKTADFFQDIPFSLPYSFIAVDALYPSCKFILTERDSDEQWFASLKRFHSKLFGLSDAPTRDEVAAIRYRYAGWLLDYLEGVFGSDVPLYDETRYRAIYRAHNALVKTYFKDMPDRLLVLSLSDPDAHRKLMTFIGTPELATDDAMPWLNKS